MRDTAQDRVSDTQVLADVFGASPIGIVVENLDGQPLFVNPAFCSFLGFSEEELRCKHCVDFSPREDAEKDWELFRKLTRVDRPLPAGQTIFSARWLLGLGALESLFAE